MVVFLLETCRKYMRGNGSHSHTLLGSLPLAQHSLVSGAHAYNNNTRPDKVRAYTVRGTLPLGNSSLLLRCIYYMYAEGFAL